MALWVLLLALLAAGPAWAAEGVGMADFRVRGYMEYVRVAGGDPSCADSFIVACSKMGRLGLRAAPSALKLLPPSTGWALFRGKMITCPEALAPISSDASGNNKQASGGFSADPATPALVPATAFVVAPGGNANTLQIRTVATQCIYEYTLTEATSFILDVQPVQWISLFSSAAGRAARLSPAAAMASALAAAALLHALR